MLNKIIAFVTADLLLLIEFVYIPGCFFQGFFDEWSHLFIVLKDFDGRQHYFQEPKYSRRRRRAFRERPSGDHMYVAQPPLLLGAKVKEIT